WLGFLPTLALVLYALLYWGRRALGAYLLRGQQSPYFRPLWRDTTVRLPMVKAPEFVQNVQRLRRRVIFQSTRLDIARTVRSTIERAGFLRPCFLSASRRPEYLVLIDRASARDHQAKLINHLVTRLRKDGQIAIEEYFFNGDPRV